jgi:hypothetical protein
VFCRTQRYSPCSPRRTLVLWWRSSNTSRVCSTLLNFNTGRVPELQNGSPQISPSKFCKPLLLRHQPLSAKLSAEYQSLQSDASTFTNSDPNATSSSKALHRLLRHLRHQLTSELKYYCFGAFSSSSPCRTKVGSPSGRVKQHWTVGTMPPSTAKPAFVTRLRATWTKCCSSTLPNRTRSSIQAVLLMTGSMAQQWATMPLLGVGSISHRRVQ